MMKSVETFRAGAARVDIGPPLGVSMIGKFEPFPATAVHDKLHAHCPVLGNGQTQFSFVICDNFWESSAKFINKPTRSSL